MKVSHYIIAALLVMGMLISGCSQAPSEAVSGGDVTIGALVPLTGDGASCGAEVQAALELSVQEINDRQVAIGSERRIKLLIEDSGTDPALALEKITGMAAKGVKIVIGPCTSAEVSAVKEFADQNGMLILGYASTAPSLAVAGDNIFRFVTDDTRQGEAMAALLADDGIQVIVPLVRDDVWGNELLKATKTAFEGTGGMVTDGVFYEPDTTDFAPDLLTVTDRVSAALKQYGPEKVAVYLIGFDEAGSVLALAAADDSIIATVNWYGSDGTARDCNLVTDIPAASFAASTHFVCPIYGEAEETEEYNNVISQVEAKIDALPDAYAVAAYDTLKIAAQAAFEVGDDTPASLKEAVVSTADSYFGATGWTKLNDAGDRLYADYDFWAIQEQNGTYEWVTVLRYQIDAGIGGHLVR